MLLMLCSRPKVFTYGVQIYSSVNVTFRVRQALSDRLDWGKYETLMSLIFPIFVVLTGAVKLKSNVESKNAYQNKTLFF